MTAVINKMGTEACEDIGLVNPEAIVIIDELLSQYQIQLDDNLWISWIKYLCKNVKNMEVDWYLIAVKKIMIENQNYQPSNYKTLEKAIHNKDESEAFIMHIL